MFSDDGGNVARLRFYLTQRPSQEMFSKITRLLSSWDTETLPFVLEYTATHLHSWRPEYRLFRRFEPEHPCWSLARCLKITSQVEDLLTQLPKHSHIVALDLSSCYALGRRLSFASFPYLPQMTHLDVSGCLSLQNVDGLEQMPNLLSIDLSWCKLLKDISGLKHLSQLQQLDLHGCIQLQDVKALRNLHALKELDLSECYQLRSIEGLEELQGLEKLSLFRCTNVESIENLAELHTLEEWRVEEKLFRRLLRRINGKGLPNATKLLLIDCEERQHLDDFTSLENLRYLRLMGCPQLEDLKGIRLLTSLQALELDKCGSLQDLQELTQLSQLKELSLSGCHRIKDFEAFKELSQIEKLSLMGLSLDTIPHSLGHLHRLRELCLIGQDLVNVKVLLKLRSLTRLTLSISKNSLQPTRMHMRSREEINDYQSLLQAHLGEALPRPIHGDFKRPSHNGRDLQ